MIMTNSRNQWKVGFAGRLKVLVCIALVMTMISGCTTMRTVPPDPKIIQKAIKPGDRVNISTTQGTEIILMTEDVNDQKISGQGEEVAMADISEIKVKEFSTAKTVGFVLGVVLVVIVIALGTQAAGEAALGSGI
jgi:hypothetical protein